mgnify:CR=1 FL=1
MRTSLDKVVPNHMRHFFPSYRVPQLNFSDGYLPVRVPGCASCVESTLATGLPALGRLTTEQVIDHVVAVNTLNGKSGLLGKVELQVGGAVEQEALKELIPRFKSGELQVEPVAVVLPDPECVAPLAGTGLREVGVQFGASDYMSVGQGPGSREVPVRALLETLDACLEAGFTPRLDLLDITRADLESLVIPLVSDVMDHLSSCGFGGLHLRLVDSLGLGLPWPEIPVPRSIPRMVHTLTHKLDIPGDQVEFLGFNDMGMALANSLAAAVHGCTRIVTTMGGLGERAGVAPTELMLIHLCGLYGIDLDLKRVKELFKGLKLAGGELSPRHPLWGEEGLTRGFAPHPNALAATHALEAPFDAYRLLGRAPDVKVRQENGPAGLVCMIKRNFPETEYGCDDQLILDLFAWVEEQELGDICWDDLRDKVQELAPDLFV